MHRHTLLFIVIAAFALAACENKTPSKNEDVEAAGQYAKETADGQKSFQNARNAAKGIEDKAQGRADRAGEALKEAKGE